MKRKKERHRAKRVEIFCFAPDAQQVFLAGTFNEWDPSRATMSKGEGGIWRVTLRLPIGSYEYKFVVDGKWVCEPGVDERDPKLVGSPDYVPNVYGTMNRKLDV
jgi:1,4-alpha-glucan branching enzyme